MAFFIFQNKRGWRLTRKAYRKLNTKGCEEKEYIFVLEHREKRTVEALHQDNIEVISELQTETGKTLSRF
jgi:hypothetical protein